MGAGQSTSSSSATDPTASTQEKTSYYALLSIPRDATEDEIKKAYRRKALELHPDRNYGNVESATALFAEVQSAYEVLSDAQERAWYDAHETQILRGDDPDAAAGGEAAGGYGDVKMTSSQDLARLLRKFNGGVEFSDAPNGFFGFVRETFEQLAKEEEAAAYWENVDVPDYPSFGHRDDAYEDVPKSFYAVWMSFSTRKSFAWMDKYRLSEAPDRRYRRLMEKENQRSREQGIRDFNDAVRALVAFVRKRDPRYIPNTQTEAERQKVLRDAAAAQAARARAANAANLDAEIPEWAQTIEKDEHEGEISESEEEEQQFECVACKKTFKSENQWEAHEKSKKHQKAVHALRKKMQKENQDLNLHSESASGDVTPMEDEEPLDEADYPVMDGEDFPVIDDEAAQKLNDLSLSDEHISDTDGEDKSEPTQPSQEKDTKPSPPSNLSPPNEPASASDTDTPTSEDDEYASASEIQARIASSPPPPSSSTQPKKGKAAQKRAKKAAAASASADQDSAFKCATCNETFSSKTKLHTHIKEEGHAALKTVGVVEGSSGGGGKKKKKGKR